MSNNLQGHCIQNTEHALSEIGQSSPPLFALIIGIDNYVHWGKLHGAVADAKAMREYLVHELRVSERHIVTLYNRKASRKGIIDAFQDLRDNRLINYGDPIVIFYAGHGGELNAPPTWCPTGKIQCLVSYECEPLHPDRPQDWPPIPDRTIGALIEGITEKKGDNITVVFDCCHASSATRDPDGYISRRVDLDFTIPETLDESIWGGRAASVHGFAHYGIKSHVLLAACGEKESAYECKNSPRGQFTTGLLKILKAQKHANSDLTYTELLGQIHFDKSLSQHPQCIGVNRNRILFDARVPLGNQVYHHTRKQWGGEYVMNAGLAHGVRHGVEITLYDDRKQKLGVVQVDKSSIIHDFETTVATSLPHPGVSLANLTRVGKLPLYVDTNNHPMAREILQRIDGTRAQQFRLVEVAEAKLEVAMESNQVIFKVLDERTKRFGLTRLSSAVARPNHVARVLTYAAHFYWFLGLAKELELSDPVSTPYGVVISLFTLNIRCEYFGLPFYSEGKCIFSRTHPNPSSLDVIDLVVGPMYGLKITNNTSRDLYLNAFLFNISDLSIHPYYTQSSAGKPEAPLKQGKEFRIGYGHEGVAPFSFSLMEGQEVDVSYLKIFFATRPIDLSDVAQGSPFLNMNASDGTDDDARGEGKSSHQFKAAVMATMATFGFVGGSDKPADTWFTLDIPVVQRRAM